MGGHVLGVEDGLVGGSEFGVGLVGVSGVVVCDLGWWLFGFPASAGIPLRLASLVASPFALRKGRAPFVLWTFPPRVGETRPHVLPCPSSHPPLGSRFRGNDGARGNDGKGVGIVGRQVV